VRERRWGREGVCCHWHACYLWLLLLTVLAGLWRF